MKKAKFVVKLPVLKSQVTFYFGELFKDFNLPAGMSLNCFEGPYAGRTMYFRNTELANCFNVVIHVKEHQRTGVIVHEIYHAASMIQQAMGVVADHNNDELGAYIAQHLFEEVMHWLRR